MVDTLSFGSDQEDFPEVHVWPKRKARLGRGLETRRTRVSPLRPAPLTGLPWWPLSRRPSTRTLPAPSNAVCRPRAAADYRTYECVYINTHARRRRSASQHCATSAFGGETRKKAYVAVGVVSSGRDRSFSQPTRCNIAARGVAKGGSDPERLCSLGVSGTALGGEEEGPSSRCGFCRYHAWVSRFQMAAFQRLTREVWRRFRLRLSAPWGCACAHGFSWSSGASCSAHRGA